MELNNRTHPSRTIRIILNDQNCSVKKDEEKTEFLKLSPLKVHFNLWFLFPWFSDLEFTRYGAKSSKTSVFYLQKLFLGLLFETFCSFQLHNLRSRHPQKNLVAKFLRLVFRHSRQYLQTITTKFQTIAINFRLLRFSCRQLRLISRPSQLNPRKYYLFPHYCDSYAICFLFVTLKTCPGNEN